MWAPNPIQLVPHTREETPEGILLSGAHKGKAMRGHSKKVPSFTEKRSHCGINPQAKYLDLDFQSPEP